MRGSDYVLLVTEPTPFGLNDLKLAVETVRKLKMPFGVLINRADVGDGQTKRYCELQRIDVLAEIPDDRQVAEAYSRGEMICEAIPKYRDLYGRLLNQVETRPIHIGDPPT
jgi:MinD superfamily P-loop ATPase